MKGDFFSRLAERTLGVAAVAKPDLMPTFLTTPESAALNESVSWVDRARSMPNGDESPLPDAEVAEAAGRDANRREGPAQGWLEWSRRSDDALDRGMKPEIQERGAAETSGSVRTREVVGAERRKARGELAVRDKISIANIHDRIHAAPPTAPSNLSRTPSNPAPAIHISIGRVEVRAVVAPAPAPQAIERKAPPRLSLDQYLRERNEGRR